MEHTDRRATLATLLLLVALTVLVGVVIAGQAPPVAACAETSALPIMPLRVDFPAYRLSDFGRSAVEVAPGGGLCLGLKWRVAGSLPPADTILVEVVGEGGQVAGRYWGPVAAEPAQWQPGAELVEVYPVRISRRAAPGRYLIRVRLFVPGGEPLVSLDGRATFAIGVLYVSEEAGQSGGSLPGRLRTQGGLEVWPFWPRPERQEEAS